MMKKLALTALSTALLTGCFGDDSSNSSSVSGHTFIAQMRAADYSSSEIAVGTVGETEIVENYANKDASDYTIDVYEQYLYHIGKFNIDTLTRYDAAAEFLQADYTYSLTEPESSSSNTYQFVQVAEDKAYVIRYGKSSILVVDPSADEENFVLGEIGLAAYVAEGATYPRMSAAVVADDKLFVGLQRLDADYQPTQSYVAVIDIESDNEIDTNTNETGLKGIPVNADNLFKLVADDDYVYVSGRGDYSNNSGALDRISLDDYAVTNLVNGTTFSDLNDISDDEDTSNDTYYHVMSIALVDDTGFIKLNLEQGYTNLRSILYSFPLDDVASFTAVNPDVLKDEKIGILKSGPDNTLWVGIDNAEAPDIVVLNEEGEVQGEALKFSMPVIDLEFMEIRD
ncbi:hypothetical protein [Thalassolituus sp. UBA3500]|uniref:hypothetical protein n=1 Tax=Thalassolituus sp. UBA3500 TaxID=1947664 RepID=UPI00263B1D96|nr:hypothetical protein [Thalassolituus sp. UBA3500]|tara:strand:+ start:1025 stop:2218 length:1194 start_codon:yes stop_codon:yes gene_type:complete